MSTALDTTTAARLSAGEDVACLASLGNDGARDAYGALEHWWDRRDPFGSAVEVLGYVVDILSAYESPEWGNVSGRFNSNGHRLTVADWHALDSGSFPHDGTIGTLDTPDLWALQELATYVGEDDSHVMHAVRLGDLMCQIIDHCHAAGTDY